MRHHARGIESELELGKWTKHNVIYTCFMDAMMIVLKCTLANLFKLKTLI